jgi:hypothetical protein
MNKISKLLKNIKTTFKSEDLYSKTDSTSTFYRKIEAYDVDSGINHKFEGKIENNLQSLERILLCGSNKSRVLTKIQEIIVRSRIDNVPDEIKDACEIVHYHAYNNIPVRISLVKMIIEDFEIKQNDIIDEEKYEEWLKYKNNQEATDYGIGIEDTYNMNMEGRRGKKPQDQWKGGNSNDNSWKRF